MWNCVTWKQKVTYFVSIKKKLILHIIPENQKGAKSTYTLFAYKSDYDAYQRYNEGNDAYLV